MNKRFLRILFISFVLLFSSWTISTGKWTREHHKGFTISFTDSDKSNRKEYLKLVSTGVYTVESFFKDPFRSEFNIFIHPDRHSLDSTWQKDWKMPDFKSECWMVASGVATRLDMISPKSWDKTACEHTYSNKTETQRIITHELIHVYHGQLNASPDFSDITDLDWFVEGLAVYASGQCDSSRVAEVIKAVNDNSIPMSLDKFWTGKLKYGLSGTLVMYIDHKYGRNKLTELLKFNRLSELLSCLGTSEPILLSEWKNYIEQFTAGQ